MAGLIEAILIDRYGHPRITQNDELMIYGWNDDVLQLQCKLTKPVNNQVFDPRHNLVAEIYGDFAGGSIFWQSLNLAMFCRPVLWGDSHIDDLQNREETGIAQNLDKDIFYFMYDAAGAVYGIKNELLYQYDHQMVDPLAQVADRQLIECLGELEPAIIELIQIRE